MKRIAVLLFLALCSSVAFAQSDRDKSGGAERWNMTGPQWHATECGLRGFAFGVGVGEDSYVRPCSIPVRVCEFEKLTISFPALPDSPACAISKPEVVGALKRTELRRW